MYLLKDKLAEAEVAIKRLVVSESNRKELWDKVKPIINTVGAYVRDEARLEVADRLKRREEDGVRPSWTHLVKSVATFNHFVDRMGAACNFNGLDIFRQPLLNAKVNGLDNQPVYVDCWVLNSKNDPERGHILGLRNFLNSLSDKDYRWFIESTLSGSLNSKVSAVAKAVTNEVEGLEIWKFDKDAEPAEMFAISAYDKILSKAEWRAREKGKAGALNVLTNPDEIKGAIALRGALGALCRIVLKEYAIAAYFDADAIERNRKNGEQAYVYHSGAESMMVMGKGGLRGGPNGSGKDDARDLHSKLVLKKEYNEREIKVFVAAVLEQWQPFERALGKLPIEWERAGNATYFLQKDMTAWITRQSAKFGDWLNSKDRKEADHDKRVAQQFKNADQIASRSIDSYINEMM